ncbi:hypothetical protein Dimus_021576 [Dionaea muscipula]
MSNSNGGLELYNNIGCRKKRKKWSTPGEQQQQQHRVFRFKSFGSDGYPAEFNGSFWRNVKALLEFGNFESNLVCGVDGVMLSCWSFELELHRHRPDRTVFLFVVEEPVEASSHHHPHCKQCQYIGWGHHMICNVKYHFVLPSKETAVMAAAATCFSCQGARSKIPSSFVENEGHALHGVFHCNGFGHLLCLNGLETGSELAGHHLMDFWDRLCTGLRAKKVSLTDISQKKGMELRLLHGIAYAAPWFSRWGYRFGRGSFGITESMYQKAIQAIQNIPLCLLLLPETGGAFDHYFSFILTKYQALSHHSLITLADIFHFMLNLKSHLPKEPPSSSSSSSSIESSSYNNNNNNNNPGIQLLPPQTAASSWSCCRWSPKRVEMATRVIVDALKRAEFKWVSRQEVRDAARAYIGDTGLLDFVLKTLGNHVVGTYLVRRSLNPVTKVLEYRLETLISSSSSSSNQYHHDHHGGRLNIDPKITKITRSQLAKDIFHLYNCIILLLLEEKRKPDRGCGLLTAVPVATRIILDSKHLFKEYFQYSRGPKGTMREILCTLQIITKDDDMNPILFPCECLVVRESVTTTDDLMREVEKYFREMYWGLRSLVIIRVITNLDHDYVYGKVEDGAAEIVFEGVVDAKQLQAMWESSCGTTDDDHNKYIDCAACGTKEDDGERMVACDICEVWQHTRRILTEPLEASSLTRKGSAEPPPSPPSLNFSMPISSTRHGLLHLLLLLLSLSGSVRLRAFKRWMTANGIECSDALDLMDAGEGGISVNSGCELKQGDLVATIPKEACLTIKTSGARVMVEDAGLDGCLGLSVAIMYERSLGPVSPWAGYLQLLPHSECLPLVWSLDEVDSLLLGTELHKADSEGGQTSYLSGLEGVYSTSYWYFTTEYRPQFFFCGRIYCCKNSCGFKVISDR